MRPANMEATDHWGDMKTEIVEGVQCPICQAAVLKVTEEHTGWGQGVVKTTEKYRCSKADHMPWGWTPKDA